MSSPSRNNEKVVFIISNIPCDLVKCWLSLSDWSKYQSHVWTLNNKRKDWGLWPDLTWPDLYLNTERSHHLRLVCSPSVTSRDQPVQSRQSSGDTITTPLTPDLSHRRGRHSARDPEVCSDLLLHLLRSKEELWSPSLWLQSSKVYWQEHLEVTTVQHSPPTQYLRMYT